MILMPSATTMTIITDKVTNAGITMAKDRYAWYDPRRYWVILKAKEFADICDILGKPAYMAAIRQSNNDIASKQTS